MKLSEIRAACKAARPPGRPAREVSVVASGEGIVQVEAPAWYLHSTEPVMLAAGAEKVGKDQWAQGKRAFAVWKFPDETSKSQNQVTSQARNPAFTTDCSWTRQQVRAFALDILGSIGDAQPHVSADVYRDMVRSRVLGILMAQHRETLPTVAISELLTAVEDELGVGLPQ